MSDERLYCPINLQDTWGSARTPENFFKQARKHIRKMQDMQGELQKIQGMFNGMKDPCQYHCDVAIKTLTTMQEPIQASYNLLLQPSNLPLVISPHWYQLMIALRHIGSQGQDLEKLLTAYRSHCHLFSKQVRRQREEIYFRLKALSCSSSDYLQKSIHLLDEAQFLVQQARISYTLEEEEKSSPLDCLMEHMTIENRGTAMPTIDPDQIFIARDAQMRSFHECLEHWLQDLTGTVSHDRHERPSPNNKIQGLVALLYGHGGFGKSTLLKHYHQMASEFPHRLKVSSIIDWEFESDWSTAHFNSVANAELDPLEYTAKLCNKLADALNKRKDEFKEYKQALNSFGIFRNEVQKVAEKILQEKQYHLLNTTNDQYTDDFHKSISLTDMHDPRVGEATRILDKLVWKGANIQPDLLVELYRRLQIIKSGQLYGYLDFAYPLSAALGRDLSRFAKRSPIILFFDTYEKIDEGDSFLRVVMKSAGARVGWVIAGRDNLWAGFGHTKRSIKMEYGYKDLVRPDHMLPVDFDTSGAGAFSLDDIMKYFSELQQQQPSLPAIGQTEAERIWQVTQGVPLAVGIIADLYARRSNLQLITESTGDVLEIVDQIVRRYLRHVPDETQERAKLYGLALIRRADDPQVVFAALGLEPGQEDTYERELAQLHKYYSFVFTEKGRPFLHQEVRYFLRAWLLEHRLNPEEAAVIEHLRKTHTARLEKLEECRSYKGVQSRLKDRQWVETYIDQAEIECWSDIKEGIGALLLFIIAASIHDDDVYYSALEVGSFFEHIMPPQYLNWWQLFTRSLLIARRQECENRTRQDLEQLAELIEQGVICCSSPLATHIEELLAIVWWKLGQTYRAEDEQRAIDWYQKALPHLIGYSDMQQDILDMYRMAAYKLFVARRHEESIPILDDAVKLAPEDAELRFSLGNAYYALKQYRQAVTHYHYAVLYDPEHVYACMNLGNAHYELKGYKEAITEYNTALRLMPDDATIYYNRGNAYDAQRDYQKALADFDHAIALAPDLAYAYGNRGHVYAQLRDYPRARADYKTAFALKPTDINIAWTVAWASFGRTAPDREAVEKIEAIAELDPDHYTAYLCRGIASIHHKDLKTALAEIQKAVNLEPEEWDPLFWKGIVYAYCGRTRAAKDAIKKALDYRLPPLLLLPLYWFEKENREFFTEYAVLLLQTYGL